jgi:hypothetical protein
MLVAARGAVFLAAILTACAQPNSDAVTSNSLTAAEEATLNSLRLVDDYPLYTLQYHGSYRHRTMASLDSARPAWACALFAAFGDSGTPSGRRSTTSPAAPCGSPWDAGTAPLIPSACPLASPDPAEDCRSLLELDSTGHGVPGL